MCHSTKRRNSWNYVAFFVTCKTKLACAFAHSSGDGRWVRAHQGCLPPHKQQKNRVTKCLEMLLNFLFERQYSPTLTRYSETKCQYHLTLFFKVYLCTVFPVVLIIRHDDTICELKRLHYTPVRLKVCFNLEQKLCHGTGLQRLPAA